MALVVKINKQLTGLANPLVRPKLVVTDGLQGAYWFTSGSEGKAKIDHSGNGNDLTTINSPLFKSGRIVVGGGNGLLTPLSETANLTYMIFAAREEVASEVVNVFIPMGNSNNDPTVNDYGIGLRMLDSPTAINNIMTYRTQGYYNDGAGAFPIATLTSATNKTFAGGANFECIGCTVSGDTLSLFQPRVQQAAVVTDTRTTPAGWSNRRLFKNDGVTPIPVGIGVIDDANKDNFNCSVSAAFVWNRALTASEFTQQYNATKAQLQSLASNFEFPTRYAGL